MDGTDGKYDGRLRDSQTMHITCVIDAIALHANNVIGCVDAVDHLHRPAKRLPPACKERQGSQGVDPSQVRRADWRLVRHGQPLGEQAISPQQSGLGTHPSSLRALLTVRPKTRLTSDGSPDGQAMSSTSLLNPDAVSAVAEAHRLAYGHLFNQAFATETSLIDPLPHPAHRRISAHARTVTPALLAG